ncbi:hypothetical protein SprV_0902670200 [Sparganum proliferum]
METQTTLAAEHLTLETPERTAQIFQKHVNNHRKSGPQTVIDESGQVITNGKQIANVFNKYFSNNYTVEAEPIPQSADLAEDALGEVCSSEVSVKVAIKHLFNANSSATDKISPDILKQMIYAPIFLPGYSVFSNQMQFSRRLEIFEYCTNCIRGNAAKARREICKFKLRPPTTPTFNRPDLPTLPADIPGTNQPYRTSSYQPRHPAYTSCCLLVQQYLIIYVDNQH